VSQDVEHLRLLSIFHYIMAGLGALCSFFPAIYLVMGIAMLAGWMEGDKGEPAPAIVGWIFVAIGVIVMLFGFAYSALLALAGRFLSRRKHRTFCFVMAGLSLLFAPVGTALGVFTIIVLMRDSVRLLFEQGPEGSASPGV
jgi:hypothetical protein